MRLPPQHENPFDGLGQWDRDLQKATRKPFAKLLAAGLTRADHRDGRRSQLVAQGTPAEVEAEGRRLLEKVGLGDKLTIYHMPSLTVKTDVKQLPPKGESRDAFILEHGHNEFQKALNTEIIVPAIPDESYPIPDNLVETIEAYEAMHPQLDLPVIERG